MKKILIHYSFILSVFLLTCFTANAVTSFSGKVGIKADTLSDSESNYFDPIMKLQGFFSGQFDFSNNTTIRTEVSVITQDILEGGIAEDTDAKFKVDELSITKQFMLGGFSNYFSLFSGTYEPIGSDIFLRRHFGIEEIDSVLTQTWLGLKNSTLLPFDGTGGSYIIQPDALPIATGLYIYVNHRNTDDSELNLDLRFGGAFNNFCIDIAGGFGAPLKSENTETQQENFLTVDELYLHGGTELFIGNKYSGGLFAEIGIQDLKFTRNGGSKFDYSSENLYLLIEPRFVEKYYKMNISFYSFPKETIEHLSFIDNNMGFDINLFNDMLHIKSNTLTFGSHFTASWDRDSFSGLKSFFKNDEENDDFHYPDFKISPYIVLNTPTAIIKTMLELITSDFSKNAKDSVRFNASYQQFL